MLSENRSGNRQADGNRADKSAPISVVIVTYNSGRSILEALSALEGGAWSPDEIIIVDNSTNPDTWREVSAWKQTRNSRLRLVEGLPNHCLSAAWNIGIHESSSELVALLNDDLQFADATWLRMLGTAMENDRTLGVVGPTLLEADGETVQSGGLVGLVHTYFRSPYTGKRASMVDKGVERVKCLVGAALVTRRSLAEALGGFDTDFVPVYFEDTDFMWKVRLAGFKVGWVRDSRVIHLGGSSFGKRKEVPRNELRRYSARHQLRSILKNASALAIFPELSVYLALQLIFARSETISLLSESFRWNLKLIRRTAGLRRAQRTVHQLESY